MRPRIRKKQSLQYCFVREPKHFFTERACKVLNPVIPCVSEALTTPRPRNAEAKAVLCMRQGRDRTWTGNNAQPKGPTLPQADLFYLVTKCVDYQRDSLIVSFLREGKVQKKLRRFSCHSSHARPMCRSRGLQLITKLYSREKCKSNLGTKIFWKNLY